MPNRSTNSTNQEAQPYPFGPAEWLELHPRYAQLRENEPIARVEMPYGGEAWLLTRHEDVKAAKADPRFSLAATVGKDVPRLAPVMPLGRASSILTTEGASHSRLRKLVAKAFTARRIAALRPRTQEVVDQLLRTMIAEGPPTDLAASLAWPLPITMICELLGVPLADRDRFCAWAHHMQALTDPERITESSDQLDAYLAELIALRRAKPTEDLLGALVTARDEADQLSERELVSLAMAILLGGYESTASQLANSVYALLSRRELWEELVADPDKVPSAVEELLRFLPRTAAGFPRIATEDVELGGITIRARDAVLTATHAANRDPAVFYRPEEIDLSRAINPHLTFGPGVHHCLGAPLARMELQVAIATLVRQLPALRLAVPAEQVQWRTDHTIRGIRELPVTW